MIIVSFFLKLLVATVNVVAASNYDVELAETRTIHFARLKSCSCFEIMNKIDCDYPYWQILALIYPLKYHGILFYPINPRVRVMMAGIVNEVYSLHIHQPRFRVLSSV